MGYMKQLYTELQEASWEREEIEAIPSKLAWEMSGSDKVKEKVKELKEMGFVIKGQNLITTKNKKDAKNIFSQKHFK